MSSQGRYIAGKILVAIPTFFGIIIIAFALIHMAPGDPLVLLLGESTVITPELRDATTKEYGLDKPLYEQFALYVIKMLQGDLGFSYSYNRSVISVLFDKFPASLLLGGAATAISSALGVVLGVIASRRPYSIEDNVLSTASLIGYAIPPFWLAMLLLYIFSLSLNLFPVSGMTTIGAELSGLDYIFDVIHHLTLPALSVALFQLALVFRITRASILEVLREDFVITATAKGLTERRILYGHILRNALLPVVTIISANMRYIVAGVLLVEVVFSWPGLGRLLYDSILGRDYPLMMGSFAFTSISVIAVFLITDVVYGMIDPRIRYRKT